MATPNKFRTFQDAFETLIGQGKLNPAETLDLDYKNVEIDKLDKNELRCRLKALPSMGNGYGTMHSAWYAAVSDAAAHVFTTTTFKSEETSMLSGMHIDFLSPVKIRQEVVVTVKLVKATRSLIFLRAEVTSTDGSKVYSTASITRAYSRAKL